MSALHLSGGHAPGPLCQKGLLDLDLGVEGGVCEESVKTLVCLALDHIGQHLGAVHGQGPLVQGVYSTLILVWRG